MLRANSGAFSAVCAASNNVECADNVEHFFLKGVSRRLIFNTRVGVIENALFAGTSGADITASVAANATGELVLPELKAFVGRHSLKLFYLVESGGVNDLALLAEKLVVSDVLFGFTVYASVGKQGIAVKGKSAVVKRFNDDLILILGYLSDTVSGLLYLTCVNHSVAGNADSVYLFSVKSMLCEELIEAIRITGLEEYKNLGACFCGVLYKIFGKVSAAKIVPYKFVLYVIGRGENCRCHIVIKFSSLPAEYEIYRTVRKQSSSSLYKSLAFYFLPRRSSNLLFSPRATTFSAKSFIVAANFAPSAADTHSTRVRSLSIPR